jgi:hypothetical protein
VEAIIEWGPVDEAGTVRAPTLDEMLGIPLAAQVALAKRMIEEISTSSEEGNASSKPSSTLDSSATTPAIVPSPNGPATTPSPSVSAAPSSS